MTATHAHDGTEPAADAAERDYERERKRKRRVVLRADVVTAQALREAAARHSRAYRARARVASALVAPATAAPAVDAPSKSAEVLALVDASPVANPTPNCCPSSGPAPSGALTWPLRHNCNREQNKVYAKSGARGR